MLAPNEVHDVLNEVPLFAGIGASVLEQVAGIAEELVRAKGTMVYEAGDEALDMFVLYRGLVSFNTARGTGHLNVQPVMKRHMIFGWAALIPDHPRRLGSAQCLDDSHLLAINGDRLYAILRRNPESGFIVMSRLCSLIAKTFVENR